MVLLEGNHAALRGQHHPVAGLGNVSLHLYPFSPCSLGDPAQACPLHGLSLLSISFRQNLD